MERLNLWYMTIMNTYVDYDFIQHSLVARYKLDLAEVYSCNERRTALSPPEKRRLREIFSNSAEEVSALEDPAANKTRDLLSYVIESPIRFQNAYSEVFRGLCSYLKGYLAAGPKPSLAPVLYQKLSDISEVKERVGTRFNDVDLDYENWAETEARLENHTFESGYSHWVDRMLKCDYVLYHGEGFVPYKVYELPHFKEIIRLGNICPNAEVPSDHLPVAAVFRFTL